MISEPVLDFWVVLKIISVIQCLFFSTLIISTKNENPGAQKYLVLFLLIFGLLEMDDLFFHSRYIFQIPHWVGLVDPLAACLGPLIYFYTSSLTNSQFSLSKRHYCYFLPILALYLLWTPVLFQPATLKIEYLLRVFNEQAGPLEVAYPYNLFFASVCLALLYGFIFLALSFYKLQTFQVKIKQLYSSIDAINLSWLKFFLVLTTVIWLSSFLNMFIDFSWLFVMDFFVFPVFIFLISYYDIRQKRIPVPVEMVLENQPEKEKRNTAPYPAEEREGAVKYAKSGFNEERVEELSGRLISLIHREKIHVKNDLSLHELADRMNTSTHTLSQLLNEKMNQSFYEFINFQRVEEVKRRLASDEYKNLKVLAIAFDSGFNSKTTFNAAFKKYTGLSPTEYRKSLNLLKTPKLA